jgi:hypothetical protein
MDEWSWAAVICMGCAAGVGLIYYVWRFTRRPQPQEQSQSKPQHQHQ